MSPPAHPLAFRGRRHPRRSVRPALVIGLEFAVAHRTTLCEGFNDVAPRLGVRYQVSVPCSRGEFGEAM